MGKDTRSSRSVRCQRREPDFLAMLKVDQMSGLDDYDPAQFINLGEVVETGDGAQEYIPRGRQARQLPPAE